MFSAGSILDYSGYADHKSIDRILSDLKKSEHFKSLDKTTGKRVYAVIVECLENISRHSTGEKAPGMKFKPYLKADEISGKVVVRTGNAVPVEQITELKERLDQINQMEESELTELYEKIINMEARPGEKGAGLGFVVMMLKSRNPLIYGFTGIDCRFSFFETEITVNRYIMRKLIVDKTASSPKVILDPEKGVFEISGESRPHDVGNFYGEILTWFDDYSLHLLKSPESIDPLVFKFDLEYFNSSSAKYILDFCKQMASVKSKGKKVEVRWQYEEDDSDMLEAGREMSRIAKLPFEFVRKENG
jgi:hypothetical protein